ncbi:MAG: T9SS type A sorting domain-containing protein [Pelobium sp.]
MNNKFVKISSKAILFLAVFAMILPAFANGLLRADTIINKSILKLKDNRPNRPVFSNVIPTDFESFMYKMTSIKTGSAISKNYSSAKVSTKALSTLSLDAQKPIDNVKIYPNPVSDQLNLSYYLKKEGWVTIKVLDVLGNEVSVLFSQKLAVGEQTNTFYLDSKLSTGFYFVRVIAGSDSIIKRISVL